MVVRLTVVIPCYNEEKRIKDGFNHYFSYLKNQKYAWELIFVNDGSTDKTLSLIKEMKKNNRNIKIIDYKKNMGKGYAIVKGINSAKGNYVLFADVDHSVPINSIKSFFEHFKTGFDVVIASRRVKGAKIVVHQKPFREFLGRGFTLLVNLFIFWGIKDATCGFKAFTKNAAEKIFTNIKVYDWSFDAEILFFE